MKVFVLEAKRTPIGAFGGAFKNIKATEFARFLKNAFKDDIKKDVQSCIIGQVLTAGSGQSPAKQTCLNLGLSEKIPCLTLNKVCGSGLKAIVSAYDEICLKKASVAFCGGQESMSQAPYLIPKLRWGHKLGDHSFVDSILNDGLKDPLDSFLMGEAAEWASKEHKIGRKEQDEYAISSYKKALKAQKENLFSDEITPITLNPNLTVSQDEQPQKVDFDKIGKLKAVFSKDGVITAANASSINDGACFMTLASQDYVEKNKLSPLCEIIDQDNYSSHSKDFTSAPVYSIQNLLKKNSLKVSDIDLWEINEAFSLVPCIAKKLLKIPEDKLNVHGGAVSLGHPIGASGARIVASLIYSLKRYNKSLGVASICLGGGEAISLLVKRTS